MKSTAYKIIIKKGKWIMKVSNITNKQINMNSFTLFNKVKKRLLQAHVQLKALVCDVFEKKTSDNVQKGREMSDKNLPSFIWGENDYKGTKVIIIRLPCNPKKHRHY